MNINLYPCFKHWTEFQNIWIYSDPHFSDQEMRFLRKNYIGDDEQVACINSKVGKKDLIIFLGDIGNTDFIKKVRGYKVLIQGNHDVGASIYKRQIVEKIFDKDEFSKQDAISAMKELYPDHGARVWANEGYSFHAPFNRWEVFADNGLFDEVYEGPVVINEKIILSHEPLNIPYFYNIHGHDHSGWNAPGLSSHYNCCAENINYTPVNLKNIIESGVLKGITTVHRATIDNATKKRKK